MQISIFIVGYKTHPRSPGATSRSILIVFYFVDKGDHLGYTTRRYAPYTNIKKIGNGRVIDVLPIVEQPKIIIGAIGGKRIKRFITLVGRNGAIVVADPVFWIVRTGPQQQ